MRTFPRFRRARLAHWRSSPARRPRPPPSSAYRWRRTRGTRRPVTRTAASRPRAGDGRRVFRREISHEQPGRPVVLTRERDPPVFRRHDRRRVGPVPGGSDQVNLVIGGTSTAPAPRPGTSRPACPRRWSSFRRSQTRHFRRLAVRSWRPCQRASARTPASCW